MAIQTQDMLKVWMSEVQASMNTVADVEQYSFSCSEPAYYEVRVPTQIGGAYWAIRSLGNQLGYDDHKNLVRAMDEFFNRHCKNIVEAYELIKVLEDIN